MSFVEVAGSGDIPAGTMKAFTVAGQEIVVINHDGRYYAIARRCPHMGGDLSKGTLAGTTVTCPRHHAQFDVTTGQCLAGPKIGPLKLSTHDQTAYPVRVEGGRIQVEL
jgi:3-phenylpropionate/trans-cinnamate dioxygenase ferredoxin subunit